MPRGYTNGIAEVTVRVRFFYDSHQAREDLMSELKHHFEHVSVNAGYWGFDPVEKPARVRVVKRGK